MNKYSAIMKLQLVTFLDSTSYGLTHGLISPHLIKLGGDHLTVGLLSTANLITVLISDDVAEMLSNINGKKYALFMNHNIAIVANLILLITSSCWFTILAKAVLNLTHQSQSLCRDLLIEKTNSTKQHNAVLINHSILSGAGYVVGPIMGGYIYDYGFGYVGLLAVILSYINIKLIIDVPTEKTDSTYRYMSCLDKWLFQIKTHIENMKKSECSKNWHLISVNFLFSTSVIIYFTKYTQILSHNFSLSNKTKGYTTAYINVLIYASSFYSNIFENIKPVVIHVKFVLLIYTLAVFLSCKSESYEIFMFLLVVITVCQRYVTNMLKNLLTKRPVNHLVEMYQTISVTVGLLIPLLFGVTCNHLGITAVHIFTIWPAFLSLCIIISYSRKLKLNYYDHL